MTTPRIMHNAIRRIVWNAVRDEAMRRARSPYLLCEDTKIELIDLAAWCNSQVQADAQIQDPSE
jgi:hypothetical protein